MEMIVFTTSAPAHIKDYNNNNNNTYLFTGPQEQRKGAKLAELAEQCIIVSGVGLAVGAHGEKGTSVFLIY